VTAAVALRRAASASRAPALFDAVGGGEPMLDGLLSGVWEGLAAHGRAVCPVCGTRMEADRGPAGADMRAHCAGCGSTLS
jgi:hypothetical protein